MSSFPYFASDLDGTIVISSNNAIIPETIASINRYQNSSDNKFFLATGRHISFMTQFIKELNVKLPVIASNGAAIIDPSNGEVLFKKTIGLDVCKKVLKYIKDNNLQNNVCSHSSLNICGIDSEYSLGYFAKMIQKIEEAYKPKLLFFDNFESFESAILSNDDNLKFLFTFDPNNHEEISTKLIEFGKSLNLETSFSYVNGVFFVDFMSPGINKGVGVKKWSEIVGVDVEEVFVAGDNTNDIEMISQSRFGIAVGNAVESAKEVAFTITDTIENNGVGKFLEGLVNSRG